MSTRDPPSPADGPARDVFATARHGQHGQRKHTRSLVPSLCRSLSLSLSGPGESDQTHNKRCKKGKVWGWRRLFKPITEDECPGPDSPGLFKPESVQALGVGSRGGGASENVGDLATSPNMA